MRKEILFDSIYIHSYGGLILFNLLIDEIIRQGKINNFFFLIDQRNMSEKIKLIKKSNLKRIIPNELNRFKFYKKNRNRFNSNFCLSNIPPPIRICERVDIYFHNVNFIKPDILFIGTKDYITSQLKKIYINFLNKKIYNVIVQSNIIREEIDKSGPFSYNQKKIFPFFDENSYLEKRKRVKNSFLYVGSGAKHKNHNNLLKAFESSAKKNKKRIILNLTLSENEFNKSLYNKTNLPKNLVIKNHKFLDRSKLNLLYSETKYFIYPSFNESFGLPLIEAVINNCNVIASNKKYVHEIITPSLSFNPKSINDIEHAITFSLNNKLKSSSLKVDNKLFTFVEYLTQNVRQ